MTTVMGKEASLDGLEFDGDTVLCRVCGDKASGFHYGVHACEGCKGFFRRSIQQKIQYRPCLKNQQCNIMRVNRNRCQYCRLKKCIAVGMSRDAVRFGRVPKKEKARIIEQMQKSNLQTATTQMSSILISTQDLVQSVIMAHRQTSELSQDKARMMRELSFQKNDYVDCPAHMACPLNFNISPDLTDNQDWKDFSEFFAPAIKSVVDFAKLIPGFMLLNQDDQVTLLKAATFEVLLVRMACLFDPDSNTMMFANGRLFKRQSAGLNTSVGFLLDSMFDFADRFNKLCLSEDELALFSAVVLLSPDRPGLRNMDQVEKIQSKLIESLTNIISTTHMEDATLFAKLLMKSTDLRTLNALHSEKTVGHGEDNEMNDTQTDAASEDSAISDMSAATMNSMSGMDTSSYDSNGSLVQHRFSGDVPHQQQQLVLKTPYGTFYREDTGFYGMVPEQPRRRCHTLDKDSVSRPRLHTIEEGNRRRYTMDREYINKMVNKLSDRLENRNARGDSMPTSINNSAASSPILEERYSYLNANKDFIPISTPDSNASSSCTSPAFKDYKDTLQPFSSSPNSPRPRSDSIGTDDFGPMRPRCSSFHMNSEGHASRSSRPYTNDCDILSAESQMYRMSAEMRRGSVGTSYGLHAKKKSLLVDRHPAYLSRVPDAIFRKSDKPRSPLATEIEPNQGTTIGSGHGSAFEQVPRLSVPAMCSWSGGGMRGDHPDPPILSVTAPQEDIMTEVAITQLNVPIVTPLVNGVASPAGSGRNSPVTEEKSDSCSAELFHKKFDKMRKHMIQQHQLSQQQQKQQEQQHSAVDEMRRMENLSIQDPERGEYEEVAMETEKLNTVETVKLDNNVETRKLEKLRLSAGEAHPQLLAQLNSGLHNAGLQFKPNEHPGFTPITQAGSTPSMHRTENTNVVLTIPKAPFVTRTSPVGIGSHPVLEQMIRQGPSPNNTEHYMIDTSPRICSNYIMNSSPANTRRQFVHGGVENQTDTIAHLKDKIMRKQDCFENVAKVEQHCNENLPMHFPNYMNGQTVNAVGGCVQREYRGDQFGAGFVQPGYEGAGPGVGDLRLMYPQLYGAGVPPMVGGYNQHLAGMQQLVYGNPQHTRFAGLEGQPLNLTQGPNDEAGTSPSGHAGLIRKVKEEIIS